MRAMLVLGLGLALSGCNLLITHQPLIRGRGAALPLKDGLWLSGHGDCAFDADRPIKTWPACADGFRVSGGKLRALRKTRRIDGFALSLSPGAPWLMQSRVKAAHQRLQYAYFGIQPSAYDLDGDVTAAAIWIVSCGPTAPGEPVTKAPFAGLTMTPRKNPIDCTTRDVGAARNAARLSRFLSEINNAHRIRDGDR